MDVNHVDVRAEVHKRGQHREDDAGDEIVGDQKTVLLSTGQDTRIKTKNFVLETFLYRAVLFWR